MKKTTIDTTLLPEVWLTWETTKGTFYLECATGKKKTEAEDWMKVHRYQQGKICIRSGSKPRYGYAKYHANLEMLELAEVTIDTTRKESVKHWRYVGEKYFLKKDKTVLDENGNVKTNDFTLSVHHYSSNFKGFLGLFYRIAYYTSVDEFKKFLGADSFTISSGRVVNVYYACHIQEWYKSSQKVRKAGKQQKLTDKLVEMRVKDSDEITDKYSIDTPSDYYGAPGIIEFERLEDGWYVLRLFKKYYNVDKLQENERMYLHDDGANRIVAPSGDKWVPAKQMHTWSSYIFVNKEEAMANCKRLKYIIPLVENEEKQRVRNCLITILRFPEIEQMINLGYGNAARRIANSQTPKADLKYMFGGYYNEKERSLLRKAGITKHQLDKYMDAYARGNFVKPARALSEMRKMFGERMIHLDNKTFDYYYDGFVQMDRGWGREPFDYLRHLDLDREKFIKNIFRLGSKNKNVYTIIDDTARAYNSLNRGTHPEINWYFDTYSDVVRTHDAIDELKREQDSERRAMWNAAEAERRKKEDEKRIKIDKERKRYEYEDNAFLIRLPNDSNEIVREGSMQRICIGGYTTRHAIGETNLFFIRKKNEPEVPFYAIEMNNNNVIVQIHGYCNSWLGNNPEVIPTVVRWLRKNGIKCDERILTCTSKGYCSNNSYIKMPVVD